MMEEIELGSVELRNIEEVGESLDNPPKKIRYSAQLLYLCSFLKLQSARNAIFIVAIL